MSDALACPRCGAAHPSSERFCRDCAMPLVVAGTRDDEAAVTERQARARKVKPQLSEGDLVRAVGAGNQAEAEFIQGLLLEEGVPSTLRRTRGFDVPDMLAAGPRDVMVPASGYTTAREVLLQAELLDERSAAMPAGRVAAGLLGGVALVGLIAWVGTELIG